MTSVSVESVVGAAVKFVVLWVVGISEVRRGATTKGFFITMFRSLLAEVFLSVAPGLLNLLGCRLHLSDFSLVLPYS